METKLVTVELQVKAEDDVDIPEALRILKEPHRGILLAGWDSKLGAIKPVCQIVGVNVLRVM